MDKRREMILLLGWEMSQTFPSLLSRAVHLSEVRLRIPFLSAKRSWLLCVVLTPTEYQALACGEGTLVAAVTFL